MVEGILKQGNIQASATAHCCPPDFQWGESMKSQPQEDKEHGLSWQQSDRSSPELPLPQWRLTKQEAFGQGRQGWLSIGKHMVAFHPDRLVNKGHLVAQMIRGILWNPISAPN